MTLLCRVGLPLRPLGLPPAEWHWVPLPFCLLREGIVQRRGVALPDQLPKADHWELLLPPADVTWLEIPHDWLRQIPRHQWRNALPNLLEPRVLGGVEGLHFALSHRPGEVCDRVVIVDDAWMGFLHAEFAVRGTSLAIFVGTDWFPAGYGEAWCCPTLEAQELGWVVGWRGTAGQAGGYRGRVADVGKLPWLPVSSLTEGNMQDWLSRERQNTDGIDLCQFEWASRGFRQWSRLWQAPLRSLLLLLLMMGLGLIVQRGSLEWQFQGELTRERAALERLGRLPPEGTPLLLWAHVQTREVSRSHGLAGEFVRLSQDMADLISHQPGLIPVSWHYQDHRLVVRFASGGQPASLTSEAERRGWHWQMQGKDEWVLEEGHS
ncbi:MAG: type II secretion system protein GspL [Betaproteobacteria bacterium]|jgi:General secretion pathway protein L (GspL).|nr:type II secretion system protein GspL [Betaproteobacteria bacterium]